MHPELELVLTFVNAEKSERHMELSQSVPPQSVARMLGDRRPEASWIVAGTMDYQRALNRSSSTPELLRSSEIVSGNDLLGIATPFDLF